ncbi:hypothetical protein TTHERM_000382148 (macronuclear) [Tetrahymena thermophila SB210]|uniref:Uncharacterized protein n=1 Tax=Tetrahymena thermophila (strain SB210) TaxID=312017 RepID=W7XAX3_TETTS|nr:hypothetical protein TTHERM_000382148 [Tetrahymena thermophila SB210]EWS74492.1 hypothetical protein TTHERM_000382148 [Tetrahymena thermophila SB210]|eukprot:XP_012652977.1 hypothetical protein TTHERM_000382148 [Tetrahymena thermophila SB210]
MKIYLILILFLNLQKHKLNSQLKYLFVHIYLFTNQLINQFKKLLISSLIYFNLTVYLYQLVNNCFIICRYYQLVNKLINQIQRKYQFEIEQQKLKQYLLSLNQNLKKCRSNLKWTHKLRKLLTKISFYNIQIVCQIKIKQLQKKHQSNMFRKKDAKQTKLMNTICKKQITFRYKCNKNISATNIRTDDQQKIKLKQKILLQIKLFVFIKCLQVFFFSSNFQLKLLAKGY